MLLNKLSIKINVFDTLASTWKKGKPNQTIFELNVLNIKLGTVLFVKAVLESCSIINNKIIKY